MSWNYVCSYNYLNAAFTKKYHLRSELWRRNGKFQLRFFSNPASAGVNAGASVPSMAKFELKLEKVPIKSIEAADARVVNELYVWARSKGFSNLSIQGR